jgi:glycosyltransferase involved in cell wall biosynthesis
MSYACLVPFYRLDTVSKAIDSAINDGWKVETMEDKNYYGVCKMREALLNRAFVNKDIKFVRYLDDDDVLLPHLDLIKSVFDSNPDIDLIYTDYVVNTSVKKQHHITFLGDPLKDCISVHPWSWIARVEALHKIKDIYGNLWNYEKPCREGTYCWINFLKAKLKMLYVPVKAYQYNISFGPNCISQHPYFGRETLNVVNIIKKLM